MNANIQEMPSEVKAVIEDPVKFMRDNALPSDLFPKMREIISSQSYQDGVMEITRREQFSLDHPNRVIF